MAIRLDKMLSDLGIASRKELKQMIRCGRVTVNGCAAAPETKIDPESDRVELDGNLLGWQQFRYFMMDKPTGVLTAARDRKQKTVLDLLPEELKRLELFPVGRLDKDTSGLLILTTDGDFAHKVISPKHNVNKVYWARVEGHPNEEDIMRFREGIVLGDGTECLPAELEITGADTCLVTVREGKYHQVRRMLAACGKPVVELRRLSEGGLQLDDDLGPGGVRELTDSEVKAVLFVD